MNSNDIAQIENMASKWLKDDPNSGTAATLILLASINQKLTYGTFAVNDTNSFQTNQKLDRIIALLEVLTSPPAQV